MGSNNKFELKIGILSAILFLFVAVFPAQAARGDITAPTLLSPGNGEKLYTSILPLQSLQWNPSTLTSQKNQNPGNFSIGYLVEVVKIPNNPPQPQPYNVDNATWSTGISTSTIAWTSTNSFILPDSLLVDTNYMWRVRGCLATSSLLQGKTDGMESWCGPWGSTENTLMIDGVSVKGAWTFTLKLGQATLVSPYNPSSPVIAKDPSGNPSIQLTWNKVPGASTYTVAIVVNNNSRNFDVFPDLTKPIPDQIVAWIPSKFIVPATTYTWNVTPSQGTAIGTQSDTWSFFTDLSAPTLIFPQQNGTLPFPPQNIAFTWKSVPGASAYIFQLFDSSGKNLIPQSSQSVTQTSFNLGSVLANSLDIGRQYAWKVIPSGGALATGSASETWQFTVIFSSPKNLSPDGNVEIPASSRSFSWDAPPNFQAVSIIYKWEILKGTSQILSGEVTSNLLNVATNIDLTRLGGGTYTWHVQACSLDKVGCSEWSFPGNFVIPDLIAPTISRFDVMPKAPVWVNKANSSVSISWSAADNNGGSGIDHYELWIAPYDGTNCNADSEKGCSWSKVTRNNPVNPVQNNSFLSASITSTIDTPPNEGIWWYGLHAIDKAGNCIAESGKHCGGVASDSLDIRNAVGPIKILVDVTSPKIPFQPIPTAFNPPQWKWEKPFDNDSNGSGSGIAKYNVHWCDVVTFPLVCASNSATVQVPATSFTQPSKVTPGDWYFWVQAVDLAGNESGFSDPGKVTILTSTSPPPTTTMPSTTAPTKAAIGAACKINSDCQTSLICEIPEEWINSGLPVGFCAKSSASPYFVIYPPQDGSLLFNSSSVGKQSQNNLSVLIHTGAPSQDNNVSLTISGDPAFTFTSCEKVLGCMIKDRTLTTTLNPSDLRTYGITFTPISQTAVNGQICYSITGVSSGPSDSGCITLQGTVGTQPGTPGGTTTPSTGGPQGCPPGSPPGAVCLENPLGINTTLTDLINRIIDFIFSISLAVVPIMVVVAAIFFVTGSGDPQRITQAKSILIWTVVGFVIILLAKGLPLVIRDILKI